VEYVRRQTEDPAGHIVAAFKAADQSYKDALAEYKALGISSEISIDPTRSTALEDIMTAALATRTIMLAGLESAVEALADQPEPTVKSMERLIAGLQRGKGSSVEIARLQGLITTLEGIATSCFT
jgi:hypothetical protein